MQWRIGGLEKNIGIKSLSDKYPFSFQNDRKPFLIVLQEFKPDKIHPILFYNTSAATLLLEVSGVL